MTDKADLGFEPGEQKLTQLPDFDAWALYKSVRQNVVQVKSPQYGLFPTPYGEINGKGAFLNDPRIQQPHTCMGVTDNHVVGEDGKNPTITTYDGQSFKTTIYDRNIKRDLAYFRIDNVPDPAKTCPGLKLSTEPLQFATPVLNVTNDTPRPYYPGRFITEASRSRITQLEKLPGEDFDRPFMLYRADGSQRGHSGAIMVARDSSLVSLQETGGPGVAAGTPARFIQEDLDRQAAGQSLINGNRMR